MKIKYIALALALVVCLVCAGAWGLSLDEETPRETRPGETAVVAGDLVFSELCTKNETIIADNFGRHRDYIELYNGGEAVSLEGCYLTDGRKKSEPFGDVFLATGEYLLIFLGDDLAGFSLGASGGDCVQLISHKGKIVAQANTIPAGEDQVMVLQGREYVLSYDASPGFSNDEKGIHAFREGTVDENPELLISEVLTQNVSSLPDEQGQFRDVVELYNASGGDILLSNYYLSDSLQERFQYRLPDQLLPAGDYVLVFCDGENYIGEAGEIHSNFGLTAGDTLCLTNGDGEYVSVSVEYPGEDVSLVRTEDGVYAAGAVSLGYPNSEEGAAQFYDSRMDENAPLVINEVLLSSAEVPYEGGFSDAVEIMNRSEETISTVGWFLSDGGDPYAYPLPQKELAPGEYWVIPCSREETGFSLSTRDTLRLTAPDYKIASLVSCALSQPGQSICLGEEAYTTGAVTLGFENSPEGELSYRENAMPEGLRISEMMSANRSYLKGGYAATCDWIELYNASGETVNLADYYLTDDSGEPQKFRLSQKALGPGEYCVLLLSDETTNLRKDLPILPFTLSSQGETIYLSQGGKIEDYVNLPQLATDMSYGRAAGMAEFSLLSSVTPGSANGSAAELSQTPVAVTLQGAYDDVDYLEVELSGAGDIYYTTDCQRPNSGSTLYDGPIRITKTTVIRAISYEEGKKPSQVVDLTYVVNEGDSLPVASIVTDPANLWDFETGIYVEGPNPSPEFPHLGANYWQPWEKSATVSLFELDGSGFSVPCGIRIFGAYSRALEMKAFSCFFRDSYGEACLDYPLFGEEGLDTYESFIFRCSGQDFYRARMRDVLTTSLAADYTNVAVQKYRPVVLYLNGEFWGVYYIREKINENYVAGNYNVAPEDVTLCVANGTGKPEYKKLIDYVKTHDLSVQENYDYVCSQVDIEGYMDYIIAEIWVSNTDNGNIKFFKTTEGKWTWILYDTDYGFSDSSFNALYDHLYPGGTGASNAFSTALINALLKNPEFKDAFIRRLAWQMNTIWTEEVVFARIDELEALIGADMVKDCQRWNRSYTKWQENVNDLREFVGARNKRMLYCIQEYFGLTTAQMREYGFQV